MLFFVVHKILSSKLSYCWRKSEQYLGRQYLAFKSGTYIQPTRIATQTPTKSPSRIISAFGSLKINIIIYNYMFHWITMLVKCLTFCPISINHTCSLSSAPFFYTGHLTNVLSSKSGPFVQKKRGLHWCWWWQHSIVSNEGSFDSWVVF
jgi:hypothetical protein